MSHRPTNQNMCLLPRMGGLARCTSTLHPALTRLAPVPVPPPAPVLPVHARRTQSEVRTLSSLLERSQQESRSLLEKKESLLHAILHLETSNSDLDAVNSEVKKELWRTSNSLNRLQGKFEELQVSSAKMEQKLKNDILELKLE